MDTQWEYVSPDLTEDPEVFSEPIDFLVREADRWREKAIELSAENYSLSAKDRPQ